MRYNILIDDIENNKQQFEKLHQDPYFYGGSTAANICGVGFLTPLDMWLRKTGRKGSDPVNAQMRLGNFLEPFVREEYSNLIEQPVRPVNQVWQHKEHDWMIGSPDALTEDGRLVEIKTGRSFSGQFWKDGQVSDSALVQMQWYLAVAGNTFDTGVCLGMFGGDATDLKYSDFKADTGIQDQLFEQVEAFRKLVKEDTPPAATEKDGELVRDYIAKQYNKEKEIDLSETQGALLAEFVDVTAELSKVKPTYSKLEKQLKALKNQLVSISDGAGQVHIGADKFFINKVVKQPYTVTPKPYYTVTLAKRREEA